MQVEKALAAARATAGGRMYWFCSDGCRDRFVSSSGQAAATGHQH